MSANKLSRKVIREELKRAIEVLEKLLKEMEEEEVGGVLVEVECE